jgi:hypothetical protein
MEPLLTGIYRDKHANAIPIAIAIAIPIANPNRATYSP